MLLLVEFTSDLFRQLIRILGRGHRKDLSQKKQLEIRKNETVVAMEKKGVSPMVATILLISIVFGMAAALIAFLTSTGLPEEPIKVTLGVEGFYWGSKLLILNHLEGDTIFDAFTIDDGRIKAENWGNLEVNINARLVETDPSEDAKYNGNAYKYYDNVPEKAVNIDFGLGDVLVLPLKEPLIIHDVLLIHYAPKDQLLFYDEII